MVSTAQAGVRVVIVGASGFIGAALADALLREGAILLCTARDPVAAQLERAWPSERVRWIAVDFDSVPNVAFWSLHLRPGDVVVNTAGILREARPGQFEAVHHTAPAALFEACEACGVRAVIQVSALGAAVDAASAYHRSKGLADHRLRSLGVASCIVRPSLVWGPEGTSARLFSALAVLPFLAMPEGGRQLIQPVHLDDVVAGMIALMHLHSTGSRTVAFVGPEPVSFRAYLRDLRGQLGYAREAWVLAIPARLFLAAASFAGRWGGSLLDAETARMLLQGNVAPAGDMASVLGRHPRPHGGFVAAPEREALRTRAWVRWLAPLLRVSIALVWIWTFIVSIGLYPRNQSLDLLAQVGIVGVWADWMLTGAALFDLALGIAGLALSAALRSRLVWPLQLALMAFYTVVITLTMPEFWLHPFGPLSKNIPLSAAILAAWAFDGPARAPRRT